MRLMNVLVVGLTLFGPLVLAPSASGAGAKELKVGHKHVDGRRIKAHSGRWSMKAKMGDKWVENAVVIEETERAKVDGKDVIRRKQTIERMDGIVVATTCILEGKTLAPMSQTKDLQLPAGAQLPPGIPIHTEWTYEGKKYRKAERTQSGESTDGAVDLAAPMFELNVFGLVVAALPLRAGYSAVIPVAMDGGAPGQCKATQYRVTATVFGKEKVSFDGRQLEAWRVDTSWADYESGEVTSPGGPDKSGGAYWIVSRRKGKMPHVLRYKNDTADIDLIPMP